MGGRAQDVQLSTEPSLLGRTETESATCPEPIDTSHAVPSEEQHLLAVEGTASRHDGAAESCKALELRVAELEGLNANLERELKARPICYQFAPLPSDEEIAGADEDDVELGES